MLRQILSAPDAVDGAQISVKNSIFHNAARNAPAWVVVRGVQASHARMSDLCLSSP